MTAKTRDLLVAYPDYNRANPMAEVQSHVPDTRAVEVDHNCKALARRIAEAERAVVLKVPYNLAGLAAPRTCSSSLPQCGC